MDKMPEPNPNDQILGVDRNLLESFLILIRDNYPQADQAAFFLETRTGITNIQGMANLRDVLSHLSTMLNPSTANDKKESQLHNAEEHLRRATIEPYEIAFNAKIETLNNLYDEYVKKVVPVRIAYTPLGDAPSTAMVSARVREIQKLSGEGRAAKGKNLWTKEWENGVTSFIVGYDKLEALCTELRDYIGSYDELKRGQTSKRMGVWSIIATIIIGILGFLVAYLLYLLSSTK